MCADTGDLADLYFGRDDAEMDIAEGGLLREGFLRTSAYDAALKAHKHLIIGRKGSGKSAICRTLAASPDGAVSTSLVTPDEVSADEMRRFELQGITAEKAKELVWRYVLSIVVARHVISHAQSFHPKNKARSVEALRKFLVSNGEVDQETFQDKFWRAIQRLKGSFSLEAFGIKVAANLEWPSEGVRAASQLDIIEKNIRKALTDLACTATHPRLLILVDQVDDVWSDDRDSNQMVVGLLRAGRLLSSVYSRVACVIFLRTDIYDMLQFFDKDKLHSDEMRVDWTKERLLQMVLTRAQASLGRAILPEHLWEEIFPVRVEDVASREYIVAHTLMRPRDVIHLCNLCRDTAEQNGHSTITESDVRYSIVQYSQWKLQDLVIEYRINYPFLSGLIGIFQDSGYIVLRDGLERKYAEIHETLRSRYPEHVNTLTIQGVIDVLFDIGFLGVRRGQEISFGYAQNAAIEPTDSEFFIHPCFRPALRSVTATIKDHYEPNQLVYQVQRTIAGDFAGRPGRSAPEFVLLRSITRGGQRILDSLKHSDFPPEARNEISAELRKVLDITAEVEQVLGRSGYVVDAISHTYGVAQYLDALAEKLDRDGFCNKQDTRFVVRTIQDVARQLLEQVTGSSPLLP
jgi:hypothetical protein